MQALGFASLLLLANYQYLAFRSGNARMHSSASLAAIAGANILSVAVIALLTTLVFAGLKRIQHWPVWELLLAAILPPLVLARNTSLIDWPPHPYRVFLRIPGIESWQWPPSPGRIFTLALSWLALLLLLRMRARPTYNRVLRFGGVALSGFGIFGILATIQLVRAAVWSPPAAILRNEPNSESQHRLVWIVFDELSHRQTFEHRATDLWLPHFDDLRNGSTLYTNVLDAGYRTETVMPSLLIGKPVIDIDSSTSDQTEIKLAASKWQPLDPDRTLFAEAQRAGWRTGIAGWWNPYCRWSAGAVSICYWTNWDPFGTPMSRTAGIGTNTLSALRSLFDRTKEERLPIQGRRATYDDLYRHAILLLKNENLDFIFLHLPVPHPPGFYNRHTGTFTETYGSSYLDNLALADKTLGDFLAVLKASPRWSKTTLVVNGDHSWRINIWRKTAGWTAEDAAASAGYFDPRPALLIHRPFQKVPSTFPGPFPLLRLHDEIVSVLQQPS